MTKLLEVSGLAVAYGNAVALESISFDIDRGEFITFIGPNGAGKTTLLNCLMGVLSPKAGTIAFDGRRLGTEPPEARVAGGMVLVPERRELFPALSVEDHLRLGAFLKRRRTREQTAAALDRIYTLLPKLAERRRQLAGTLSGGEQQMVAVGRALMSEPQLLMLDEPSTGLAPRITEEIFEAIDRLRADGMTGILVEQNANLALSVASRGYVMEVGGVVASGTAADLRNDPRVMAAYLGVGDRYRDTAI
ncbi:ABC transporter ATP-binding protein [Bradyrhizobium sp.]|uniref:ABC transporter ATP-binding protein n=1 Tax=Bradyrhizobium sp. TaxID=376 RepID=UPI0039E5B111